MQKTLRKQAKFQGIGLHTGEPIRVNIFPAPENSGIVFKRGDMPFSQSILAHPDSVLSTDLSTTIGIDDVSISTVEHLMAALRGLEVDNAFVEVFGPEIPILDGSSYDFLAPIMNAGVIQQFGQQHAYEIDEPIYVNEGDRFVHFMPFPKGSGLTVKCSIDFARSGAIGKQSLIYRAGQQEFSKIAKARTFCHVEDVELMRSRGLALGGSLQNAIVVDDDQVLNPEGLRYSDEFVRHKILDFIGDIALLYGRLDGYLILNKPGHGLHKAFMDQVLEKAVHEKGLYQIDGKPHVGGLTGSELISRAV